MEAEARRSLGGREGDPDLADEGGVARVRKTAGGGGHDQRFSGPAYNRVMHALVRVGLQRTVAHADPRRAMLIDAVRRLVS